MPKCAACASPLTPKLGPGRPRKFCNACVPPGTGAASVRAWRAVNQPAVAAYNARRRVAEASAYQAPYAWDPYAERAA